MEQTIKVKGMVCNRCILTIERAITSFGVTLVDIRLGSITFLSTGDQKQFDDIVGVIKNLGFEILNDKNELLIEKIISIIDTYFKNEVNQDKGFKFSVFISNQLNVSSDIISDLFSKSKGITLEKFIIHKRLDKVKEYLIYTSCTHTEIADKVGFNSVFHLSRQFKNYTGKTPSLFRNENSHVGNDINSNC